LSSEVVGAEHRDELAGVHGEMEVVPEHAIAERQPGGGQRDNGVRIGRHKE
jgi:hypothetical protein